ncbi:uncharacterized protein [Montipora capricornis]
MFLKLTRPDLKELFPEDSPTRKHLWDFIISAKSSSNQGKDDVLDTDEDGQKMEHFLHSDVPSNFPYLVLAENGESSGENTQIFIVLEKDVLCECQPILDYSMFASPLVSYLAVYYAFNLEYGDNWKNIFKFLEEHVLGITPKRKSYQLKQIENKLLRKLKACSNTD